ncbi:MAG: YggS family pyridoxal phosphate-dependent enzyme, partial [Acidobacteriota bacterium]
MPEPPAAYQTLAARLADVREKIHAAAGRANRAVDQITLIAISKTHPREAIRAGLELGITDFGENRVQEAEEKISELGRHAARWHLVGHLQANKAR